MSITSSRPLSSALALFHAVLNPSTHGAISRPSRTSQHWVRLSTTEIFNMLFSVPPWKRQPACQTAAAASLLNSKSVRAPHTALSKLSKSISTGHAGRTIGSWPSSSDLASSGWSYSVPPPDPWCLSCSAAAGFDPLQRHSVRPCSCSSTNHKVWAAKFTARHPNLVALEISSFKCGHDAPIYGVIEGIIEQSGTPYFCFKDLDENKPSGSIRIRVETIDYFLRRYREEIIKKRKAAQDIDAQLAALEAELRNQKNQPETSLFTQTVEQIGQGIAAD